MATKAYKDVAALLTDNPDWDINNVTSALKGKYSDAQIASAVGDYLGGVSTGDISINADAANKKKLAAWSTPKDLETLIKERAVSADPTAGGTTLTTQGGLSPLTNKPLGGDTPTGSNAISGYSVSNLAGDFMGNQAQGIAPRVSMSGGVDPKTGKYYVQQIDPATGAGRKVYIFGDPNNPAGYKVLDYVTGAQEFIASYTGKGKGGVLALKQFLASNGLLSGKSGRTAMAQGNLLDGTTVKAVQNYLDELTTTNFLNGPTKQNFIAAGQGLTGAGGLAGTRTSVDTTITPKDIAAQDLSVFMGQQLGRGATAKEVNDYVSALNDYEKAHPDKTTTTTDSLGFSRNKVTYTGATAEDKKMIMVGVLGTALVAKGINPDTISQSGGAIARGMQDIQNYATNYGLGHIDNSAAINNIINASKLTAEKATAKDTLNLMLETLKPGGSIDTVKSKIKEQSKMIYKPLASYIDTGGTVADIADQYNKLHNQYLETFTPTDVFNPDIQKALQGDGKSIMSQNDYIGLLKSKPEWAMTMNAREQASSFATSILKSFGMMA